MLLGKQYTVTYKVDGVQVGNVETYDYNAAVTVREKYEKEGYTVSEWSVTEGFNMPAQNEEITATTEIRTDLSYTVNYLEKDTDRVLSQAKTVNGQTFDAKVTESAIEIDGYTKDEPTSKTITIAVEGNEINFYYYQNVTVTANNKTKVFGEADPELDAAVSVTGLELKYNVTRKEGEAVGTYAITVDGEENQGHYKVTYNRHSDHHQADHRPR